MKIDANITLELTPQDISDIIKEYIEKQGYTCKGKIEFDVSTQYEGYGTAESPVTRFRGATVKVEKK